MTQPVGPLAPKVAAYNPDGKLVNIDAGDLSAAQEAGYSVATQAQLREKELDKGTYQQSREKGLNPIAAGALALVAPGGAQGAAWREGMLSGATAGLANVGEKKLAGLLAPVIGKTDKEGETAFSKGQAEVKEAFPGTYGTGEVAGMVGGTVASGGIAGELGLAARGGSALARAGSVVSKLSPLSVIESAGAGAEALAARATGGLAARGALGRAGATGARMAARGATETALYSGVHEMSEEMLGDHELNAQKILAAAADGAKGGAILGGSLGIGGSLARSGAIGIKDAALGVVARNADEIEGLANSQRWRALDPLKKYTKEAEARVEGGTKTVGEVMGRYGVTGRTVQEAASAGNVEAIAAKLDEAVEQVGSKLGELHATSTAQIPWGKIDDAFEKTIAPLRQKGLHENIVRSLEDAKASIASKLVPEAAAVERPLLATAPTTGAGMASLREAPVSIQDALFQRKALDQIAYRESKALDPQLRVEFLRDIRKNFEGVIVDAFDDAAKAAGNPGAKAELLALKKDYQSLSIAQDAANDSTARMATNRNISLSDYLSGGFLSNIGSAALGPIGGLAGGAAGAAVNRFGRSRGNAIAAAALDKAAEFARAQRAIQTVDTQLEKSARGLVLGPAESSAPYRSLPEASKPLRERYAAAKTAVDDMAADQQAIVRRAAVSSQHLPKTAEALSAATLRTVTLLGGAAPAPIDKPTLGAALPSRATDAEMRLFLDKYETARNPMQALRNFERGRITLAEAQTLRAVSPQLFQELQSKALNVVTTRQAKGDPLPFAARQRMHVLLGVLTDPAQDPKMMKALQANLASASEGPEGAAPGGGSPARPKRPVDMPAQINKYDKLEQS